MPSWTSDYQLGKEHAARTALVELEARHNEVLVQIAAHKEQVARLEQTRHCSPVPVGRWN